MSASKLVSKVRYNKQPRTSRWFISCHCSLISNNYHGEMSWLPDVFSVHSGGTSVLIQTLTVNCCPILQKCDGSDMLRPKFRSMLPSYFCKVNARRNATNFYTLICKGRGEPNARNQQPHLKLHSRQHLQQPRKQLHFNHTLLTSNIEPGLYLAVARFSNRYNS